VDLSSARRRRTTEQEREVLDNLDGFDGWARPLDLGAHSRSHHSRTLARLTTRGLVEARQRSTLPRNRGSKVYRITASGKALLEGAK
jgi:hypothetical protein